MEKCLSEKRWAARDLEDSPDTLLPKPFARWLLFETITTELRPEVPAWPPVPCFTSESNIFWVPTTSAYTVQREEQGLVYLRQLGALSASLALPSTFFSWLPPGVRCSQCWRELGGGTKKECGILVAALLGDTCLPTFFFTLHTGVTATIQLFNYR